MTLAGFGAMGHPQQTRENPGQPHLFASPRPIDDRGTDPALFDLLHARFRFTIDVAATPANAKLPRYFTCEDDGLAQPWTGERVWCNPPYSQIERWVMKGWGSEAELVVMLLPANRTEQGWWQRHIEPFRDRHIDWLRSDSCSSLRIEFMPGRPRFVAPGKDGIGPNERPPVRLLPLHLGGRIVEYLAQPEHVVTTCAIRRHARPPMW